MDLIETKSETDLSTASAVARVLPVSVIVPVRNEACNLPRCLDALAAVGEIYVIDSQSTDDTVAIAQSRGAKVVQFHYAGGGPKKRQWAMDTLPLAYDWILLLDADEILTPGPGQIKALIVNGANIANSVPDKTRMLKALRSLE